MRSLRAFRRKIKLLAVGISFTVLNTAAILLRRSSPLAWLAKYLSFEDEPEAVDVIIVLSGDQEREEYAADLYRKGFSPKIIMSGVYPAAIQMAQRAIDKGVQKQDIILEDKSVSTYGNAYYSRKIMLKHQYKCALIVSSPYHMRRSKLVFERVFKKDKVKLLYCPAQNSRFNLEIKNKSAVAKDIIAVEYLKLAYYFFRYW